MKKRTFTFLTAGIFILIASCHKKDDVQVVPCGTASNKLMVDEGNRNGDGPYVLNMVIQLCGENEVPPVNTPARGVAHLRLSADKKLYSKVIVQNLAAGDALRFAHVHSGATGVNGPIQIFLCHTPDDFGKNIVTELTDAQYNFLLNDPAYVNAHSNFSPPGLVRGQIR